MCVCVCTRQILTYDAIFIDIYSIKVCIRSVKIFFLPLSVSLSCRRSDVTRFARFVSLDRPRIVLGEREDRERHDDDEDQY